MVNVKPIATHDTITIISIILISVLFIFSSVIKKGTPSRISPRAARPDVPPRKERLDIHVEIVLVPCNLFDIRGLAGMDNTPINDDLGPLVTILTVSVYNNPSRMVHVSFCSFHQINLSREVKK